MQIIQALSAHRRAKEDRKKEELENKRYYAKADDNADSSSEDFKIVLRPGERGPPMDSDAWTARWRRRLFEHNFGVEEGRKKYEEFRTQPVSEPPKSRALARNGDDP
jgi:hypothetical protein